MARGALGRPLKPFIKETIYQQRIELDDALELSGTDPVPARALLKRPLREPQIAIVSRGRTARYFESGAAHSAPSLSYARCEISTEASPAQSRIGPSRRTCFDPDPARGPHGDAVFAARSVHASRAGAGAPGIDPPENPRHGRAQKREDPGGPRHLRPGWGPAESNLAFRHFRPPLDARFDKKTSSLRAASIQGTIEEISGPWRTSGDWWRPTPGIATNSTWPFPTAPSIASISIANRKNGN